ncbi:MAG: type II toxin-antitoxin system VapC family toxin [Deltaproteobacteria bacterium]|nr:type II toxin-antitoxin system VapC family toxin [Deltaproteobacteria bacterium]MBW2318305.1 type II toxin-antitoxin system VapC family toxin [Deltaproteobacteria bacterium]
MKWLCDTNVISEVFKWSPDKIVTDWITQLEVIFLSVVTVEEIYCGLSHKDANKTMQWFDKFMRLRCHILPATQRIAKKCGVLRGQFLKKGISRTQADLLIAATAIEHNLALATRNTQDFENCGIPIFNPFS